MVINSQHNSADLASSLVTGVIGTLLALASPRPSPRPSLGRKEANLLEASCQKGAEVKEGIGLVKEYGDK